MHFWRVMKYRCTGCRAELDMHLEDGCEGPPGGREVNAKIGKQPVLLRFTPDANSPRMIQPVPFSISCTCSTKTIGPAGKLIAAYKAHVDWRNDRDVDITTDTPTFPYFEYDQSENPQACGIPRGHR